MKTKQQPIEVRRYECTNCTGKFWASDTLEKLEFCPYCGQSREDYSVPFVIAKTTEMVCKKK